MVSVTDGDTLDVLINGQLAMVRLYRADALEVQGCGGNEATNFTRTALCLNDNPGKIWIESGVTDRDR